MSGGWLKVKQAASYASVSERTFRSWLQQGLRYCRLPSGRILIRPSDIDAWLERFCEAQNRADGIVAELMDEIERGRPGVERRGAHG